MNAPLPSTDGHKASSLGERLYAAFAEVKTARGNVEPFAATSVGIQALYERAAVRFVASLTYAESQGVREALLSSVLLEALEPFGGMDGEGSDDFGDDAPVTLTFGRTTVYRPVTLGDLRRASAAIAQAEARASQPNKEPT